MSQEQKSSTPSVQVLIAETTQDLAKTTEAIFSKMLGLKTVASAEASTHPRVSSEKPIYVSAFFTGIVYGEFILAMSEETANRICAHAESKTAIAEGFQVEKLVPLAELLNIISGQAIANLGRYYDKLTLTSPRIFFGNALYPACTSGKSSVTTPFGEIECHFYLDRMELDLAVSYHEALQSVIGTNQALMKANETLKKQQAQLVHSEKMASLGMMAAGVAHEINNPLAYVDSNISTLEEYSTAIQQLLRTHELLLDSLLKKKTENVKLSLDEIRRIKGREDYNQALSETKDIFEETRSGVLRIKEIIAGLKKFSHIDQGEIKEVDLNDEIENMLKLVANQLKYKCTVIRDFGQIPKISCYPGQLNQVFVNLLVNSSQAMPSGGEIRIISRTVEGFVEILFADTGTGIAPENMGKIFDPFFSTKPVGEGTGLGLSISYGIIQKHGGTISVESSLGKGTVFTIRLPLKHSLGESQS